MSYAPLLQERQNQEARKLASESVHVVSLPSRNTQGRSQPVYRSSLTKRKVTEEEEVEVVQDITVRVMSSQSVLVAWTDPLYEKQKVAANRQYSVRYREKGESARWDYKQVSNRRALVENLAPDTMYEFAVQILDGEKEGKWSVSVYQRTPEAAPASAPENLDVWPLKGKPTSVAASWDALPESEGKVKEYILSYAPALKPFGAKSITYSGATTSAIIDGLQAGERYIFKIRAANRRGPGPQSKAFSVAIPAAPNEDSVAHQQKNIQDNSEAKKPVNTGSSPSQTSSVSSKVQTSLSSKQSSVRSPGVSDKKSLLSEYKNKILSRGGVLSKSQLPSRKTEELESDLQSTEVTDDHNSSEEAATMPPKAEDQRRVVRPVSPSRTVHPVLTAGRTPVRTHTSDVSRQANTEKHEPSALLPSSAQRSSASSVPKYTDNETKQLRQSNANVPSPKASSLSLPTKNNDLAGNVEEKPDSVLVKVPSKTSEPSRLALPPNRQSAVSHEVVPSHPSRSGSVGHSHQPSSKSTDSRARDNQNEFDSEEAEGRAGQPSSRSQQTRLPSGSSSRTWKDSKLAAVAVSSRSAVSGHSSPHSHSSTSAKSNGKDVDKSYREDSQDEKPLLPDVAHNPSLPSSRQSSSAIYSKRRNPHVDPDSHLRETHSEKSPHSDSGEEQQSRVAAPEKHSLQPPLSKHKLEEQESQEVKETLAQSKPSVSLPKKTFPSHLPSQKTSRSEPLQKAQTSPSLLHSRGRRLPSPVLSKSNEELQEDDDEDVTEGSDRASSHSVFPKEVSSSRGLPASFSQGSSSSSLSKQQQPRSQVPSYNSKLTQPDSSSASDTAKENQYNLKLPSTSSRQTRPSLPTRSRADTRTVSQTEKKYGLLPSKMSKTELPQKVPSSSSKSRQSVSNEEDDYYSEYDEKEGEEKPTSLAAKWSPSVSRGNKNTYDDTTSNTRKSMDTLLPHKLRSEEEEKEETPTLKMSSPESPGSSAIASRITHSPNKHTPSKPSFVWPRPSASTTAHTVPPTVSSSTLSPRQRLLNSRLRSPSQRQFVRPPYRQGYNGRPNLTTKNGNGKILPGNNGKPSGQRVINGPQGTKWIVDLDRGLVLNVEGKYLQDSQGKPLRVKLGGDGRTIVDEKGAPMVSPDGLPLFGHGRFSKPVASAQDKPIISLGGKPLIGLEMIKKTTTPSTTTTTIPTTTTTTTTTTIATTTTTTPEPTTTEPPTEKPPPTCPPGTYGQYDDEGNLLIGFDGLPECNAEVDTFSGLDSDVTATPEAYVIYDDDYEFFESTLPPTTTTVTTTTASTTTESEIDYPETSVVGSGPVSEYDIAGKKRFTAPYVTYLNKDPAAPCSLTEALEHFQVESLDEIIPNDLKEREPRPLKAPHNITVVAVEGCHSFVIVDWAKPARGDMVTGYLVYSASYDDFLKNKWSTRTAGTTHLPIENLKPNTRYYFKVQAKNPFGYGPVSSSVSFITESDNPLLIVRPPGGEPIWIPFTFKYDPTYSDCSGKQYVKRTWYRKFVGVVLCNSLRYKIYLSDDLKDTFYSIGDSWGRGEDHCQFVDSHLDGRTGPQSYVEALPTIRGYYRQYRQEPVSFGRIGHMTPYYYVGWYECGVPIPGKW